MRYTTGQGESLHAHRYIRTHPTARLRKAPEQPQKKVPTRDRLGFLIARSMLVLSGYLVWALVLYIFGAIQGA